LAKGTPSFIKLSKDFKTLSINPTDKNFVIPKEYKLIYVQLIIDTLDD
jgi:hypothetical protein